MMNVLIVDSSDIELRTIKDAAGSPERWIVSETTFEELLNIEERKKLNQADVLVLNFTTFDNSIFETIRLLKHLAQQKPLVALHIYRQEEFISPLFKQGVDAYIPIEYVKSELVEAIGAVRAGYTFESRHLVDG